MRLERAAADRIDPPREVVMTRSAWDAALEEYYAEHDAIGTAADARGPTLLQVDPTTGVPVGRRRRGAAPALAVRQTLDDPEGHHDWVIEAIVDLDASDEVGEAVVDGDRDASALASSAPVRPLVHAQVSAQARPCLCRGAGRVHTPCTDLGRRWSNADPACGRRRARSYGRAKTRSSMSPCRQFRRQLGRAAASESSMNGSYSRISPDSSGPAALPRCHRWTASRSSPPHPLPPETRPA